VRSEIIHGSLVYNQPLRKLPDDGKLRVRKSEFAEDYFEFTCPGCGREHAYYTGPDATRPRWTWNGSLSLPTFYPSMIVHSDGVCHFFVTDGEIEFVGDSTHHLAAKTVLMPEISA
jgi:hypothetical protein